MKPLVYIQVDEELSSVHQKLKRFSEKSVHVVIPSKALIFRSAVNLKWLKGRLKQKNSELVVITKDRIGQHLCRRSGVRVQEKIRWPFAEHSPKKKEPLKTIFEPIQARPNELRKDSPQRVERKMTIGELIRELRQTSKPVRRRPSLNLLAYAPRSRSRFLGMTLLVSAVLFVGILYVALPDAAIYIRPSFQTLSHSVNVNLADRNRNQNLLAQNQPTVIAAQTLVRQVNETRVFNAVGKIFNGANAQGAITVINESEESWDLRLGTRFQNPDGLIFRSKVPIDLPPAIRDGSGALIPSTLQVPVEADPFDAYGKPAGERANIGPSQFTLPGLSGYEQQQVYGRSSQPMTGGVSSYSTVIQPEDVEAAKAQMEESLALTARQELQAYVDELNRLNDSHLALLDDERYLTISIDEMRVSEGVEGTLRDKFEVFAQITVTGIVYDFDQLFSLLKRELRARTHPEMKLKENSITPQHVQYESVESAAKALEEYERSGQIKMTVSVRGIQEYDIDTESVAGLHLADRIREKVLGASVEEAESIIGNLPEVDAVKISTWPFWVSHLPRVGDNIEVRLWE